MKAGTTSLHYYMGLHPQIFMSHEKELSYFIKGRYGRWGKGQDWYLRQFRAGFPVRGETSPAYTNYPRAKGVPERMHALIPDAKLIYLVREPLARAVSHFTHRRANGLESLTLDQALEQPDLRNIYVNRSLYYLQLEQFFEYYAPEKVLVISTEELNTEREVVLQQIFRFLEVEPYSTPAFQKVKHQTQNKRQLSPQGGRIHIKLRPLIARTPGSVSHTLRRLLLLPWSAPLEAPTLSPDVRRRFYDFVRDDVAQLRAATGLALSEWDC